MTIARLAAMTLAALALAGALACGAKEGRSDYPGDGDTGQAAPATVPTVNHPSAPDSANGTGGRTGERGIAGDSLTRQAADSAAPAPGKVGEPRKNP